MKGYIALMVQNLEAEIAAAEANKVHCMRRYEEDPTKYHMDRMAYELWDWYLEDLKKELKGLGME